MSIDLQRYKEIQAQAQNKETPTMEKRETYYELYKDGQYVMEGKYEDCYEEYLHYPSDACAEIYRVTVSEEKVF